MNAEYFNTSKVIMGATISDGKPQNVLLNRKEYIVSTNTNEDKHKMQSNVQFRSSIRKDFLFFPRYFFPLNAKPILVIENVDNHVRVLKGT